MNDVIIREARPRQSQQSKHQTCNRKIAALRLPVGRLAMTKDQ